jgi:predicted transcriptional regulator of viral defense system
MTPSKLRSAHTWALVRAQHGVLAHRQLRSLGYSQEAIRHRVATGRLHRVCKGVYAVGRPDLTQHGRWMAAVLAGGAGAALSHRDAAALYEILSRRPGPIHLSVPGHVCRRRTGIRVHQRHGAAREATTTHDGIPVTSIVKTLVDLAATEPTTRLTRAVNEADKRELIDPDTLRAAIERYRPQGRLPLPGARPRRGVRRPALPPHPAPADGRRPARPGPHRRRAPAPALHARPDPP